MAFENLQGRRLQSLFGQIVQVLWETMDCCPEIFWGVGDVCGGRGRSGLTLARQRLALQASSLESVSQPSSACQPLAEQSLCSTPASGAPNTAPELPNGWKPYLRDGPRKAKGCLKPNTRQAHVFTLPPLSAEHCWNPGVGSYMCPFLYFFCLYLLFLPQTLILGFLSNWNSNRPGVC